MTSNFKSELESVLHDNGFSITSARVAIFNVLRNSDPLLMSELCKSLQGLVDRASIYRTIDLFEKLHITNKITIGWKYKVELSDVFNEHHHHIVCSVCDKIQDLHENIELESAITKVGKIHGFIITSHQIELRGICATCKQQVTS